MSPSSATGAERGGSDSSSGPCPSPVELSSFSQGRLSESALNRIGEHAARCPACEAALEAIDANPDAVVEGLRRSRRPAVDWREGLIVGEYEVLAPLGAGGMGRVWRARHRRMNREVAIKAIREPDRNLVERFQREVETLAALSHPNIAVAYDAGESAGHPYLVMELLHGRDLGRQLADTGPLAVREACDAVLQAARGLAYAHERGLVHRDVKPANLFRTDDGTIKVLDLGLVRRGNRSEEPGNPSGRSAAASGLTTATTVMGTLEYAAPEQTAASAAADHRADIYSLGCTLYALLCGASPYSRSTAEQIRFAQEHEPLKPLREVRPDVPAHIDRLCSRMLEKDLTKRPRSMHEVIAELQAATKPSQAWRLAACVLAGIAGLVAAAVVLFRGEAPIPVPIAAPVDRAAAVEGQRSWAAHLRVPAVESNSLGMALALVPPGAYADGSAALDQASYVGAHETTMAAFRRFVAATGHVTEPARNRGGWSPRFDRKDGESLFVEDPKLSWESPGYKVTEDHPVVHVSWNDAMAFCKWLGEKEGEVYRLPTLAEATWIMRAGTGAKFYFGDDSRLLLDHAWFEPNSNRRARAVGFTKPNLWGLFDTLGNVREWCSDWSDREPRVYKTTTSGSFYEREDALLGSRSFHLDRGSSFVGFRVLRECKRP